jgi:hypothetical protein
MRPVAATGTGTGMPRAITVGRVPTTKIAGSTKRARVTLWNRILPSGWFPLRRLPYRKGTPGGQSDPSAAAVRTLEDADDASIVRRRTRVRSSAVRPTPAQATEGRQATVREYTPSEP